MFSSVLRLRLRTRRLTCFALRRLMLVCVLACLAAILSPVTAFADEVDIAVDAFAVGGRAVGVSIGNTETALVKSVVRCATNVAQPRALLECAREELVKRLPQDAQPLVRCLTNGEAMEQCAMRPAIAKLPPQVRGLAECIAKREDIASCGQRFGTDQLRQAERAALNQAFATFEKLKIDAAAKNPLADTSGSIQNVIKVAEGIRDDNWAQVLLYGGPEVYKVAGKILLRVFLGPKASMLDPAVDALVQHRVDLFTNIVKAAKAQDDRRLGELTVEAYVYLNLPLVQACALVPAGDLKELSCGNLGRLVQTLAEAGGTVTEALVDAVKDPLSVPGDLKDLISRTITGKDKNCGPAERVYAANFPVCYHRAAYLKIADPGAFGEFNRWLNQTGCRDPFLRCHISSTVTRICSPFQSTFNRHVDEIARALTQASDIYTRSFIPYMEANGFACDRDRYQIGIDRFVGECESALNKQVPLEGDGTWETCRHQSGQQLWARNTAAKAACSKAVARVALSPPNVSNQISSAASTYASSFRWYAEMYKERVCNPNEYNAELSKFIGLCEESLRSSSSVCGSPTELRDACTRAMGEIDPSPRQVVAEVCAQQSTQRPPRVVRCFEGMVRTVDGLCACPPGKVIRHGRCVIEPASAPAPGIVAPPPPSAPSPRRCTGDLVLTAQGGCACPTGTVQQRGNRCIRVASPPPTPGPTPCTGDLIRTPRGDCACPPETVQRGNRCVREAAPRPQAPPRCRNNLVYNAGRNLCECPPNLLLQGDRCVPAPRCRGNLIQLQQGGCGCPPNMIQRGGQCIPRPTCRGNLVPLPQGGCGCPPNMALQGQQCVSRVRCPDGSHASHLALCRKRCSDGTVVRVNQPCPASKPAQPSCPPGMVRDSTGFCGPR